MQCVLMGNGGIIFQAVAIGGFEMTKQELKEKMIKILTNTKFETFNDSETVVNIKQRNIHSPRSVIIGYIITLLPNFAEQLADALIAENIGEIAERKNDEFDACIHAWQSLVDEYKNRAIIAEKDLERYKRALSKVIKDRNVLAKDFYYMVEGKGQLYENYYLGWVDHEMQEQEEKDKKVNSTGGASDDKR